MRTLVLYNPVSGRNPAGRPRQIAAIAALLEAHGFTVEIEPTHAPGSAGEQARQGIARGAELILACGGDGTLHDVLQGMVDPGCGTPPATLGVIPMGSANALARHLGLSTEPLSAARQLLHASPHTVPVGRIETSTRSRYFTAMAGAGPDGALVHHMLPGAKHHLGRLAYYLRAATLFATRPFPAFDLSWTDADSGIAHTTQAVATMAVRIDSLGGPFHPLAPAGSLNHPHLTLVAVRPPGWLGLPVWFAGSWLGQRHRTPRVLHAAASQFSIAPAPGSTPIHLQADGEWIGTAPAHVQLHPDALRLLIPQ